MGRTKLQELYQRVIAAISLFISIFLQSTVIITFLSFCRWIYFLLLYVFPAYKILFANQHSSTVSAEENKSKKEEKEKTM